MDYVDYTDSITTPVDKVVSMGTPVCSGNCRQQSTFHQKSQHERYVEIVDYTESNQLPGSLNNQAASADDSKYIKMQSDGYEEIPYSIKKQDNQSGRTMNQFNSVPITSTSSKNNTLSSETKNESINTGPKSQSEGYIVEYPESVSSKTEADTEYTQSQFMGYVGMVYYTHSVPCESENFL